MALQISSVCSPEPSVQVAGTEPNQAEKSDCGLELRLRSIHF